MTSLEIYDNVLIELNKVEAPSLLLSDFNYFLMKAIYQKVNKDYNYYDLNLQLADSLRPLVKKIESIDIINNKIKLENDYLHLLECEVTFKINKKSCLTFDYFKSGAIRSLSNSRSQVSNNYYMKPSYKRPYYVLTQSNIDIDIEILHDNKHEINKIKVEYLKKPNTVILTNDQIESGISEELEFSDYVCYEIINDLVKLILENGSDPRLQSHIPINQTINNGFN